MSNQRVIVLDNLAQEDPELVEEIRRLMFVFEDITKFADRDIQSVLKNVESSQWAMALKGASEDLKNKISNLCDVPDNAVINAADVRNIYELPLIFHDEGLDDYVCNVLRIDSDVDLSSWQRVVANGMATSANSRAES